ncbi:type IV secretion system protein [Aggregatibacter actinomycetemcomitans]|uniref:type IV secretion system protein n=1 Tax=Aggregatibacter actinomycetemcomitans TaxID=714 RepID=UPI00197BFD56|nr:type IV secretion system protein [Aggregatibacter actinomycetemcomitans]MBN6059385.1 type IV secretion system protein [Aggregatibacter actinomycetemcomitans]MBN6087886.1 type IV secretion system protein [Aggregatibacter actinomycetemcomitans]
MRFFENIDSFVNQLLDSVSGSMSSDFANALFNIVGASLLIYYLGKGFLILAGKMESPATEIIYDFALKLIIISFMMNYGGYLDGALGIIDDAKTSLTSFTGSGLASLMDDQLELGSEVAGMIWSLDPAEYVPIEGGFGAGLAWLGVAFSLFVPMFIFITSTITLKLMTVTAPIFIFCLLYNFLRNTFNQWVQLILANILVVVFLGISLRMGMTFFGKNITVLTTQAQNLNLIRTGFEIFGFGIFVAYISYLSLHYAMQLASVSVESQAFSMAKDGAANAIKGSIRFAKGATGGGYSHAPATYKAGRAVNTAGKFAFNKSRAAVKAIREKFS